MSNRRQTMRTYVILNITNPKTIYEEDFIPWDSDKPEKKEYEKMASEIIDYIKEYEAM